MNGGWSFDGDRGCTSPDMSLRHSSPEMSLGKGVRWEAVPSEGQQGDFFRLVHFPDVCTACEARENGGKPAGPCESPLFKELLMGSHPESAQAVACLSRTPKERRFGLELLAVLAEREEWTLKGINGNQYLGCLETYLAHQFAQLVSEGKVVQRLDESGRAHWACFCTGLLSRDGGELLYCVIKRSENDSHPSPWTLHGFLTAGKLQEPTQAWNEGASIVKAPSKALFFSSVTELVFDVKGVIGPNLSSSEVWASLDAVRPYLPQPLADASSHYLQEAVCRAVEWSAKRANIDPFLIVPQFRREANGGTIQALLPLQLEAAISLALAFDVESSDAGAQTFTPKRLVGLPEAYSNARALIPQHQPWILRACLGSGHVPENNSSFYTEKLPANLSALHIEPPENGNTLTHEETEKNQSHPGSRGSSEGWLTGNLGQGAFGVNIFGSHSSDSIQSLSPGKLSPPLEEQREYSHQEGKLYQDEGVKTFKEAPKSLAPESFAFNRMYGGFKQEDLSTFRTEDQPKFSDGFRAEQPKYLEEEPKYPEGFRAEELRNAESLDRWNLKQEDTARFASAYNRERAESAHLSEVYRAHQLGAKPPSRTVSLDPWSHDYLNFSPEAVEARVDKDDNIFVEFSPQDDLCPKVNISQLPPKFVATFLSGDANRPGFEHNAEQYAEQLFSRYGAVSKTLVRENKNHPGKWFAIVEFSYWTNEEVRQRLVAGEQIRFANFFDEEDVYVRRHKDKQSKMLRNGSGPSGLPCRPEWKYTGTDTRLGKPLYRGPCSLCGRESTVPFKPVINGQPPRCRNCLPQEPSQPGGAFPSYSGPPPYDSGLMSLRKETVRTLSTPRLGSGVYLNEPIRSPPYGMERTHSLEPTRLLAENPRAQNFAAENPRAQNFGAENPRAQSFGAENPRAQNFGAENPRAQNFGERAYNSREYEVSRLQALNEYRRTNSLGSADWTYSHPRERETLTSPEKALRFQDNGWSASEERRANYQNLSAMGGQFPNSTGGGAAKFAAAYQHSYLD